jgi:hypothetical protein
MAKKERTLEELKDTLWKAFDRAAERHEYYSDYDYASQSYPTNHSIQNRIAMGTLADAIVNVEREMRIREKIAEEQKIEDDVNDGLSRKVTALRPVKLKQPE